MNSILVNAQTAIGSFVSRFKPGIWYLTIIGFINSAGFSLSLPYVALYLNQDRGISMTVVGLIILTTGLLSAVVQLVSGALCDRLGRRPLLIASMVTGTVLFGCMALLIEATAPVWAIIMVYTGVRGAIMMANPAIQSMIVDQCPKERLMEANGLVRIGGNLGWAMGPALGGFLLASLHYSWLFGVATLMRGIALFFALLTVKESFVGCREHLTFRSVFRAGQDRSFLRFTLLCLLLFLALGQMSTTLSVYTVERAGFSDAMYGSLLTLNGLMVVALQYPVTRALQRVTKKTALMLGSFLYAVGYFSMSLVGPYPVALAAMAVVTLGEITIAPTTLSVVGEMSPATWRGRYMGFFGLSETIGVSTGPLIGGILLDGFPNGRASIWGVIAGVALLAAIGFALWNPYKSYKKRVG
jgi:MFS family permease